MSSLDKLAIRGIRSFDDKSTSVIQFYSPVTLIVGANGTGKTTIIESLKYATTGELPPNTKGGAFVHDPKMAGERDVKAQVRLRFWNVKRERMVATRNLQVSTKKTGGLTMKTLEGVLSKAEADEEAGDRRDKKRNAISTKCADMDAEIPHLMGVTTAILDNVIFCHQEEANWPLSEPAALKKKFDEIFEASKYTKAIDHIKTLRKERVADLKVDNERLSSLKKDKEKAERLTTDLELHKRKTSARKTEAAQLGEDVAQRDQANDEFRNKATEFKRIFEKVDRIQAQKTHTQNSRDELLKKTEIMKESAEELKTKIKDFDKDLIELNHQRSEKTDVKSAISDELEGLRSRQRKAAAKLGERNAQRAAYDDNARTRQDLIHDIAGTYAIEGFDGTLNRQKVEEFMGALDRGRLRKKAVLEQAQAKAAEIDGIKTSEINDLTSQQSSAVRIKAAKQREADDIAEQVAKLEGESQGAHTFEADMRNFERDIKDLEVKLASTKAEIDELRFDENAADLTQQLNTLASSREKLGAELRSLESQSDLRAALNARQESLKSTQSSIGISLDTHRGTFDTLIGGEMDPQTMEAQVLITFQAKQTAFDKAAKEASAATRHQQDISTHLDISKNQLQTKKRDMSRKEKQVEDTLKRMFEAIDEEAVHTSAEAAAESAEEEIRSIEADIMMAESGSKIFDMIAKHETDKHTCVGCDREISAADRPRFLAYIKSRRDGGTKRTRDIVAKHKADLASWQDLRSKALAVKPAQDEARNLRRTEIPELTKTVDAYTVQQNTATEDLNSKQAALARAQTALNNIASLKPVASQLLRDLSAMEDNAVAIMQIENELKAGGHTRSSNEVHDELSRVSATEKQLAQDRQRLQTEKDQLATRQRNTEVQLHQKKMLESAAKAQSAARTESLKNLVGLQEKETAARSEIQSLAREIALLAPRLRQAREALRQQQDAWIAEKTQLEDEVKGYRTEADRVAFLTSELHKYQEKGGDSMLTEAENEVKSLQRTVTTAEEKYNAADTILEKIGKDIAESDIYRRRMQDNLDLRLKESQIRGFDEEIAKVDLSTAARARQDFETKYRDYVDAANDKRAKHQRMVGELAQMLEMEKRMQRELKTDYKDIQQAYLECLFKVKTATMINTDLDKYAKALDNAIMRYHTLKMDEINQNTADLWRKTYQGTDIDTIRIRSDHDENSTSARKTYNYRVVMVKDQVELDMRGRCSAGQKVLASIIIRLALADSMSMNCGVLALDEPSTNLDQETVEGLATALAELIEERRKNANFQLIIITHDESFLTKLSQAQLFNFYWRVSRNSDQKSIVSRERTTYTE